MHQDADTDSVVIWTETPQQRAWWASILGLDVAPESAISPVGIASRGTYTVSTVAESSAARQHFPNVRSIPERVAL
ncbi:MAG: hypothetical protein WBD41_27770 [Rhodococcus sp. (in: high G+C Gram-positive bacteria)]|jgi:hypothetical protein